MIPYVSQDINQADIDAVVAVLRSEFLTQGPVVPAFEKAVANHCAAQHAVAVNSAAPANKTTQYLLSLLSGNAIGSLSLSNRFWSWAEVCVRRVYKVMKCFLVTSWIK